MTTSKFTVPIPDRWREEPVFTADIECDASASLGERLGLAVRVALKARVSLRGANLAHANLTGADLAGANLAHANLTDANLTDANLTDANLTDANLTRANLTRANLTGANLTDANLTRANLTRANLTRANLTRANLTRANLTRANLTRANLTGADLDSFKADLWMILHGAQAEAPGVIAALKAGRVDGSTYSGDCACLVGTIANLRGVDVGTLEQNARRPAERWFLMIRKGDKPGDDTGGGFAAQKALEWAEEYCALAGIKTGEAA